MDVQIVEAHEPVGRGIGAALQAREALRILQNHPKKSSDLEEKAVFLTARIILLCGMAKTMTEAKQLATKQLRNGKAREKMSQIIKAQRGKNPNINSEEIQLGRLKHEVKADEDLIVEGIDMRHLNTIVRALGAPAEYKAGILLNKKLGEKAKKGETLYTLYSESETKMPLAKKMLTEKDFYTYTRISK